ncbi:Retrotransposon gag protein [Rhizoctonia solani]|uniref:Retrotransposon gag protein n=1 Tax=Rhizoctonia solani TaxID=456999 RepID=A0A8H8SYM6_9AGAM|nr:Retrotransposon gag protein [Rhizoctonia solani]QRW23396.1 Retrotransposon gag protein [Rhizoctonia solani]
MSFDQMSDRELLDMVAQNMIILKKEFSQLQGAYEAQSDQLALLRAELEEHCNQSRNQHVFYSNQIQGAAASIQVVQDQLLHMSNACPTAPPPPPRSLPSPISSMAKRRRPQFHHCLSSLYKGKRGQPIPQRKILKKVFRGEAVPLLEDIDTFWAEFTKHYVDTNRDEKYCQKWNNLRQKASVQEYTQEFQQYSVSLGYSNETLRNKYYDGLKNDIKDIMLSTMFQWRRATAQQVYDKAEEIANHIESTCLSNPSVSTTRTTSSTVPTSTSTSNPTPACTRLNVGDNVYMIDPTTCRAKKRRYHFYCSNNLRQHAKHERPAAAAPVKSIIAPTPILASNSKGPGPMDLDGRGFANLTCHVCGGKGHFARNCPSKPMSGHVANVEWSWERPKEESRIEVVSDEEELGKGKPRPTKE